MSIKLPIPAITLERISRIKFYSSRVMEEGNPEYNGRILQAKDDWFVIKELLNIIIKLKNEK